MHRYAVAIDTLAIGVGILILWAIVADPAIVPSPVIPATDASWVSRFDLMAKTAATGGIWVATGAISRSAEPREPYADHCIAAEGFRAVPFRDLSTCSNMSGEVGLLDHLVSAKQQRLWDVESQGLRRLEIDDQL